MNKRIEDCIKGLSTKDLKYLYGRYMDMAFEFYIDCEEAKYNKATKIINLIDETLRGRGVWVNNEK